MPLSLCPSSNVSRKPLEPGYGLTTERVPVRWELSENESMSRIVQRGTARTLPEPESLPSVLNFAFASCQHFEDGHYTAYERMAQDDPDLVFHLGDYIYEGPAKANKVRHHTGSAN